MIDPIFDPIRIFPSKKTTGSELKGLITGSVSKGYRLFLFAKFLKKLLETVKSVFGNTGHIFKFR